MKPYKLFVLLLLLSSSLFGQMYNALSIPYVNTFNVGKSQDLTLSKSPRDTTKTFKIDRDEYKNKLKGFWLGSCIANWTGLPTENKRTDFPFFTDSDFGAGKYDYVLDENPWGSDDDTDIEYVYQHAMEKYKSFMLTGEQISSEWQKHIALPKLWVSNLSALGQMQNGAIPPATSLPENNPMWDMIDAQLTTEIFGAFSPGRPDVALKIAHLPIRTTAYLHSEWASEFYIIMYSLTATVDKTLSRKDQIMWMAGEARKRLPEWSYLADMYDFVKAAYDANPEKDNWEKTRDEMAKRYQHNITAGYTYKYPWDSGINFAASIISLLYGEGDYKKTIRIGSMCGWDSDNPTATWGGLLGLLYGYEELQYHFDKTNFSEGYNIARTRYNMPIPLDNFSDMATRGIKIIDDIVIRAIGGSIEENYWIIPNMEPDGILLSIPKITVPWITIEDNDPRWIYKGFETYEEQWNASGASLTKGYANCSAEITFTGTAIQYYAYRGKKGGNVTIILDGKSYGDFNQEDYSDIHGQYYVKIFEQLDLPYGRHTLQIMGDPK
ncbi:ADP-ribosylglycohydrolase family protein, partial [Eudoraea sp.]|uniref:ADP-ribosylglycohydrolase family protein n=1 Tax=Eudoraea sp. TaxID=1979955 RepID=UPI003C78E2F5